MKKIYRKYVLCCLLLGDQDKESVIVFAKRLNLKVEIYSYMLAYIWEPLTKYNLQNRQKKLWPIEDHIEITPAKSKRGEKNVLDEVMLLLRL